MLKHACRFCFVIKGIVSFDQKKQPGLYYMHGKSDHPSRLLALPLASMPRETKAPPRAADPSGHAPVC